MPPPAPKTSGWAALLKGKGEEKEEGKAAGDDDKKAAAAEGAPKPREPKAGKDREEGKAKPAAAAAKEGSKPSKAAAAEGAAAAAEAKEGGAAAEGEAAAAGEGAAEKKPKQVRCRGGCKPCAHLSCCLLLHCACCPAHSRQPIGCCRYALPRRLCRRIPPSQPGRW